MNEMVKEPTQETKKPKKKKVIKFRKWCYFLCKFFFSIIGLVFPTKIINKHQIHKKGNYIYSCNHLTIIDIPLTQIRMKGIRRYIGKKEFTEKSLSHNILGRFGVIFIDREKPEMSALREIFGVLKEENGQIMIFPEGTRNKGDYRQLLPIKPGLAMIASKSQVPIIPMVLYKPCRPFHRSYIYFGSEISLPDTGGRIPPASELLELTAFLQKAMERERVFAEDYIENKRWKKKNKLPEGQVPQLVLDWDAKITKEQEQTDV